MSKQHSSVGQLQQPSAPPVQNGDAWLRPLLAIALLLGLILAGFAIFMLHSGATPDVAALQDWARQHEHWGAAAIVALMVVHCFVPFPAEILALAAGAVYGTVMGTALIWLGAMLGAALSFWLARKLGRQAVERFLPKRTRAALDDWTEERGTLALLVSRFVPIIAFNLINYAAGLTRVGWWTFLWTTGVGILPLSLLMVHMGATMVALTWPWVLVVSAVGVITIFGVHWLNRHARLGRRD